MLSDTTLSSAFFLAALSSFFSQSTSSFELKVSQFVIWIWLSGFIGDRPRPLRGSYQCGLLLLRRDGGHATITKFVSRVFSLNSTSAERRLQLGPRVRRKIKIVLGDFVECGRKWTWRLDIHVIVQLIFLSILPFCSRNKRERLCGECFNGSKQRRYEACQGQKKRQRKG